MDFGGPGRRRLTGEYSPAMSENPQPLGGNEMPRFAGIATFMRLPGRSEPADLDVAIFGVPLDIGTSNRPGARFGPRGIRDESVLARPYNMATRAAPFDSLRIDDIGDVATNPYNLTDSIERIEAYVDRLLDHDVITVAMGGDHTVVLPILRSMKKKYGPVGLVHVDAHTDINDEMFGERIAHGTPFRRAVEEGLLDCDRVVQIGMRGTGYEAEDFDWSREQGFRVVQIEECWAAVAWAIQLGAGLESQLGNHERALKALEEAHAVAPRNATLRRIGRIARRLGRTRRAVQVFSRLCNENPQNSKDCDELEQLLRGRHR